MATEFQIGQRVNVRCHTYKYGRKFSGVITQTFPLFNQSKVKIDGNKKATMFYNGWLTPIQITLPVS